MKVLRIYDHLGELKKEFPVYVEGEDFKWKAWLPECVWLGTITLEEPGKEPEAEPTPTPEPEKVMPVTEYFPEAFERQPEPERITKVVPYSKTEMAIAKAQIEERIEPGPEEVTKPLEELVEEVKEQAEIVQELIKEEVKDEPKKVHRKRSRVKGTSPSDYLKSVKVIRQDDSSGDTTKGD